MTSPLVIAHRGSSAAYPEHTIEAYLQAIEEGADGLECDVRLTRDGHLVCIHDRRLDRTSDGRGKVSAATLPELELLDFGSWHSGSRHTGSGQTGSGQAGAQHTGTDTARVLTLDRLLEVAAAAARPLHLLIETKHPNRYGAEVERELAAALARHGLLPEAGAPPPLVRVTVMSFSPFAVRRCRQLAPGVETAFLFELAPPGVREGRPPFGASVLGPGLAALRARPDLVGRAHDRGHAVYVWTVNTPRDVDFVHGLGVDAIISDRPAMVLDCLGRGSRA